MWGNARCAIHCSARGRHRDGPVHVYIHGGRQYSGKEKKGIGLISEKELQEAARAFWFRLGRMVVVIFSLFDFKVGKKGGKMSHNDAPFLPKKIAPRIDKRR